MALVNAFGELALDSTLAQRYGGGKSAWAGTVSAAGTTTVITPAAGKQLEVFWVYALSDPASQAVPAITVAVGAQNLYHGYAISHWEPFLGDADAPVRITLSQAVSTAVTIHYREV